LADMSAVVDRFLCTIMDVDTIGTKNTI